MKKLIKKVTCNSAFRFCIVGFINTILGTTIMFCAYNIFALNYWVSSALNYIFASIFSYIMNKNFTFKYTLNNCITVLKFIINIIICYIFSYLLAQMIIKQMFMLSNFSSSFRLSDNISMVLGSGIFIVFNYLGQRFFVFCKPQK